MNKRIRVYEIVFSFDIESSGGGISRFATALSQALDTKVFEVVMCGLWDRGAEVEKERIQQLNNIGIRTFTCASWDEKHPYLSFFKAYQGLKLGLKQHPADILHSHSEFSDMALIFLKLEGKAPIIVRTLHNELRVVWKRRSLRRILFTKFLDPLLYEAEIGVSRFIKENLDARWLAKRLSRKAYAVNNALEIERFDNLSVDRDLVRKGIGIPEGAFIVGSIGRLCEQKGYDLLVEAAVEVLKKQPDTYFLIVGDGDQADALKQQTIDSEIAEKVIFTGHRSDVEALLGIMDLFVCSSRWEGLSTAIMEAMAAGVPIVATDIPGNRELLEDGKNARFVQAEQPKALADAIQHVRMNCRLGYEYSRQAQQDVQAFGIKQVVKQYERLYRELRDSKNEKL